MCLSSVGSPDEFRAGRDVAPLVTAPHLQLTAVVPVQVQEVVSLEQHVAELGEGDPGLHPALH